MIAPSDAELLTAWNQGDEEAFGTLVSRYHPLVNGACRRQAPPGLADDCIQAVFLVLARRPAAAARAPVLGAWLHRVCGYVCARARREAARRRSAEALAIPPAPGTDAPPSDAAEQLDACLDRLPARQRSAIILHFHLGLDHAQLAARLGTSASNVAQLIHRGIGNLRQQFGRRGIVCGISAITGLLAAAAAPVPADERILLLTRPAPEPGSLAARLARGAIRDLLRPILVMAAAACLLVMAGVGGLVFAGEPSATTPAAAPPAASTAATPSRPGELLFDVYVRYATHAFVLIAEAGGPRVVWLGAEVVPAIPVACRHRRMAAQDLIAAVAEDQGRIVTWHDDGRIAVLAPGVADADIARLAADLGSPDATQRRAALGRASWMADARTIPLLVRACADPDPALARMARTCLGILGWPAACAIDPQAVAVFADEIRSGADNDPIRTQRAGTALARLRSLIPAERHAQLVASGLECPSASLRRSAIEAVPELADGPAALALGRRLLADGEDRIRALGLRTLAHLPADQALAEVQPFTDSRIPVLRRAAVAVLARLETSAALDRIDAALPGLEQCAERYAALRACRRIPPPDAAAWLARKLSASDPDLRADIMHATDALPPEHAWPLLQRGLADPDGRVRSAAAYMATRLGNPEFLAFLCAQFKDYLAGNASAQPKSGIDPHSLLSCLSDFGPGPGMDALAQAAAHPVKEIRDLALSILQEKAPRSERLRMLDAALENRAGKEARNRPVLYLIPPAELPPRLGKLLEHTDEGSKIPRQMQVELHLDSIVLNLCQCGLAGRRAISGLLVATPDRVLREKLRAQAHRAHPTDPLFAESPAAPPQTGDF